MNPIAALLTQGGVKDITQHTGGVTTGQLAIHGVGLARCIARTEDGQTQVQVQWLPTEMTETATGAIQRFMAILAEQMARVPGFAAGADGGKGIVWLGVSGSMSDVLQGVPVTLGLAADVLRKAHAFCNDARLAVTYLVVQGTGDSGQCAHTSQREGGECRGATAGDAADR